MVLSQRDAVKPRHADVQQHHIKGVSPQGRHGLHGIGRFRGHQRSRRHAIAQQGTQARAGQCFVVNHQYFECHPGNHS